jgi:MFS transporter, SP family, arabinose:H+ symporter
MTSHGGQYPASPKRGYAFYVAFVASLGGFLFGYDLVIISGAQIFLRAQFALTPRQFGFATSSALLGCIAGPACGAWLCDRMGRKFTLITAAVLFAVSAAGTALANAILIFNIFRVVGGIGVGLASLASPMYLAEIAPARKRGRLGLMYQLAITIGALAATIVSYYLAKYASPPVAWRWMFASVIVPVAVFFGCLIWLPESPRWLAGKQRFGEALSVLTQVAGENEARKELTEMRATNDTEVGGLRELFQPGMRAALFTGIILAVMNNWTGWTGIAYYLPTLFQRAGFSNASDAIAQNVLVMGGNVFLTLVSVWLVDRVGRRPLWILCSAAMFCFLILAGAVFQVNATGSLVVLVIFLCAAPHAIGLGPLPWLMMSEIYPTRIRAKAVSLATTFLWVAAFTGTYALPLLQVASERIFHTVAGVFWLYAAVCLFSFVWGLKFLPETKGRSLENIADSWTSTPPEKARP